MCITHCFCYDFQMPFGERLNVKITSEHWLGGQKLLNANFCEIQGCPVNVGFNTTLALKEELQSLQVNGFAGKGLNRFKSLS